MYSVQVTSNYNASNPTSFHLGDNSTYKLQFTPLLKFSLIISFHSFSVNVINSTNRYYCATFVISECQIPCHFAPGIVRLTFQTYSDL
jgi:hypothetical protein